MTKQAQCRTVIGCTVKICDAFGTQWWKESKGGHASTFPFLPSYRHSESQPRSPTRACSQPSIFRCWFGSQSAALCMVGSTYCSVLNHKSSPDRLCTLNRHISHSTSPGMQAMLKHPSAVSRLSRGRQMDSDQTWSRSAVLRSRPSYRGNKQYIVCRGT